MLHCTPVKQAVAEKEDGGEYQALHKEVHHYRASFSLVING
jgi:hypothetical protein